MATKDLRECPLCGRYAPSMRTIAEPALMQTSSRQSKWHNITKGRRKTVSA